MRRKFFDLDVKFPVATGVLKRITGSIPSRATFVAAQCRPPRAVRNDHARVIVDDLRHYLEARLHEVSAKRKPAEVIRYALTR
ncbi:MAG: hypothetical protein A3H25_11860 [Sphingomonadales bacterium RIFCSPLOWO2_12_FULL_63_15]|nr:MAG: hypothetical protein A3H25_11860 [Sphingomonadales bacterium RIFCSPLOWO2_12_FULL_63_15]